MENRRDPLELWVGSWTPEDIIDQEAKRLAAQEGRPGEVGVKQEESSG